MNNSDKRLKRIIKQVITEQLIQEGVLDYIKKGLAGAALVGTLAGGGAAAYKSAEATTELINQTITDGEIKQLVELAKEIKLNTTSGSRIAHDVSYNISLLRQNTDKEILFRLLTQINNGLNNVPITAYADQNTTGRAIEAFKNTFAPIARKFK